MGAGPYYVNDGGDDTTGLSWATAKQTLAAAVALADSGAIVYVDSTHVENGTGSISLNPTTATGQAPVIIISVTNAGGTGGTYTPMTTSEGIVLTGVASITLYKKMTIYGVTLIPSNEMAMSSDTEIKLYDLVTGSSRNIAREFKVTNVDSRLYMQNCGISYGHADCGFGTENGARVELVDCYQDVGSVDQNQIVRYIGNGNSGGHIRIDSCDWSGLASGGELVSNLPGTSAGMNSTLIASNCKMPVNGVPTNDIIDSEQTYVEAYNCSTAADDEPNQFYRLSYAGTAQFDDAVFAAADPGFSAKLTSKTTSIIEHLPIRHMLGEVYAAAEATIRVEILSEVAPTDEEFWIEVRYTATGAGNASLKKVATTLHAHNDSVGSTEGYPARDTAGSSLEASALTATDWTGEEVGVSGFSTPVYSKCELNLATAGDVTTISAAGIVQVWIYYANSTATTIYVDGKIYVS